MLNLKRLTVISVFLALPILTTNLSAAPITFSYTGTTDDNPALPWSMTYTFASSAPAVLTPSENRADYPTAISDMSVTVDTFSFTFDPTGGIDPFGSFIAINDSLPSVGDVYRVRGVLQDAHGFSGLLVSLVLTNTNGTVFSTTGLPTTQPDPSQFEIKTFHLSHTVNGQGQTLWDGFNAEIGSIAVTGPGNVAIIGLGLMALGFARRRWAALASLRQTAAVLAAEFSRPVSVMGQEQM